MRSVLRHGDVAVDVGAYKGGYTYWMREAVGDAGTVFSSLGTWTQNSICGSRESPSPFDAWGPMGFHGIGWPGFSGLSASPPP